MAQNSLATLCLMCKLWNQVTLTPYRLLLKFSGILANMYGSCSC